MYWKRKALTHTNVYVHAFLYYLTLKSLNLIKDKNALGFSIIIFMPRWGRHKGCWLNFLFQKHTVLSLKTDLMKACFTDVIFFRM